MISYNHTRHSVFSLQVHLVFVVKRRGKAFNEERLTALKDIFDGVCEEFDFFGVRATLLARLVAHHLKS
jgi:REP element-mobilizing transposase RayT